MVLVNNNNTAWHFSATKQLHNCWLVKQNCCIRKTQFHIQNLHRYMCCKCGDYGLVTKLKPIKVSQFCQSNPASLFCPPFRLPKQKPAPVSRLTQCFSLLLWWSYLWQSLCFHAWAAPRAEGKTFKSTQAFISVSHRVRESESERASENERNWKGECFILLHKNHASSQIHQVCITGQQSLVFIY